MTSIRTIAVVGVWARLLFTALTAGHLRGLGASMLVAHLFLWGGFAVAVYGRQTQRSQICVMGMVLAAASLGSGVVFTVAEYRGATQTEELGESIAAALRS